MGVGSWMVTCEGMRFSQSKNARLLNYEVGKIVAMFFSCRGLQSDLKPGMKLSGSPNLFASNFMVGDLDPKALRVSPKP